jgi:hypothetical protein
VAVLVRIQGFGPSAVNFGNLAVGGLLRPILLLAQIGDLGRVPRKEVPLAAVVARHGLGKKDNS